MHVKEGHLLKTWPQQLCLHISGIITYEESAVYTQIIGCGITDTSRKVVWNPGRARISQVVQRNIARAHAHTCGPRFMIFSLYNGMKVMAFTRIYSWIWTWIFPRVASCGLILFHDAGHRLWPQLPASPVTLKGNKCHSTLSPAAQLVCVAGSQYW